MGDRFERQAMIVATMETTAYANLLIYDDTCRKHVKPCASAKIRPICNDASPRHAHQNNTSLENNKKYFCHISLSPKSIST